MPTPPRPDPTPKAQPEPETKTSDASAPSASSPDAASIVLPPPPLPPLIEASPLPVARSAGSGSASAGAGQGDGFGTGSAGKGTGTGAGSGSGSGAGDLSAYPKQISGKLHYWEIPKELRRARSGIVRLRYRIDTDGRVSQCTVIASSGMPAFDRDTCARITERFRFRPALDRQGRRVPFVMTETHGWDYEPPDE